MQFLLIIPIALIFYGWHKSLPSLPSLPSPIYPKLPHRSGCYANRFSADDSPWIDSDSSDDDNDNFYFMHDDSMSEFSSGQSFLEEQLDPSKSYLEYNVFHHDDHFSHS